MRPRILVFLVCGLTACEPGSPDTRLTLSATIDGTAMRPHCCDSPPPSATLWLGDHALLVSASGGSIARHEVIALHLIGVTQVGAYPLGASDGSWASYRLSRGNQLTDTTATSDYYATGAAATGTVMVTQFDPATRSIGGTFSCVAEGRTRRVDVTAGAFAGKYQSVAGSGR